MRCSAPASDLAGECIEAMASSDNVVRAGLTPKYRDVHTLIDMLSYECGAPPIMMGNRVDAYTVAYGPPAHAPVDEFMVLWRVGRAR